MQANKQEPSNVVEDIDESGDDPVDLLMEESERNAEQAARGARKKMRSAQDAQQDCKDAMTSAPEKMRSTLADRQENQAARQDYEDAITRARRKLRSFRNKAVAQRTMMADKLFDAKQQVSKPFEQSQEVDDPRSDKPSGLDDYTLIWPDLPPSSLP